jgi:UMF1 family MFS transporter
MDKTSSAGYAWGYIGGGLLLIVNMVMIINPGNVLGDTDPNIGYKISFVSVALWWFVFSIPMMRHIKEPVISDSPKKAGAAIKDGFVNLKNTFSHIRKYKELFKFLIAFFFYIDGVGTIIRMATVFASDKQLGLTNTLEVATNGLLDISMVMALGLLITQLVAWPMAFVLGRAGSKWGAKNTLYLCIASYIIIATLGTFMFADWNFLILAALVGTVQGGVQALSRSLFAVMVPKEKTGEFFGFFGIFEKFASILGPLLMSLVTMITSNVRLSVLAVIPLFVVGILLLIKVKTPDTRLKEDSAPQNTAINL